MTTSKELINTLQSLNNLELINISLKIHIYEDNEPKTTQHTQYVVYKDKKLKEELINKLIKNIEHIIHINLDIVFQSLSVSLISQ